MYCPIDNVSEAMKTVEHVSIDNKKKEERTGWIPVEEFGFSGDLYVYQLKCNFCRGE